MKGYIKNVIGYSAAVLIVAGPASGWLYLASLSALPAFGIAPIGYLPTLAIVASFVGTGCSVPIFQYRGCSVIL